MNLLAGGSDVTRRRNVPATAGGPNRYNWPGAHKHLTEANCAPDSPPSGQQGSPLTISFEKHSYSPPLSLALARCITGERVPSSFTSSPPSFSGSLFRAITMRGPFRVNWSREKPALEKTILTTHRVLSFSLALARPRGSGKSATSDVTPARGRSQQEPRLDSESGNAPIRSTIDLVAFYDSSIRRQKTEPLIKRAIMAGRALT